MNNIFLNAFGKQHLDKTYTWIGGGGNFLKHSFLFNRKLSYTDHLAWYERFVIDQTQRIWAIEFEDEHIGNIGLKNINDNFRNAEVWIYIGNEYYRGKGIASQAIRNLREHARSIGLHKLYANIATWNISSLKAFSNAGFVIEGTLRDEIFFDGKYVTINCYGLIL